MRMEEIAALAEQYGDWDDFGRWTFQNDDKLLAFVIAVQGAEREACAEICEEGTEEPLSVTALKICLRERNRIANAIRARGER